MPVLVVSIFPREGKEELVENVFREVIPVVHAEDGCELYALHKGKDRLVLIEKWRDGDSLKVHSTSPAFKSLNEKLEGLLRNALAIEFLRAVPIGEESKGELK